MYKYRPVRPLKISKAAVSSLSNTVGRTISVPRSGGGGVPIGFTGIETGALARLFPGFRLTPSTLAFVLEFVHTPAELSDGLFSEELLERPLLDILGFILLELSDEGHGTLQDGSLVLLTTRDDLCELIDTLVDRFTATSLDCRNQSVLSSEKEHRGAIAH